jgi:hypothetical protein
MDARTAATNALLLGLVTGGICFVLLKVIWPKRKAKNPIELGRRWLGWSAILCVLAGMGEANNSKFGVVGGLAEFFVALLMIGPVAFLLGWLYGCFGVDFTKKSVLTEGEISALKENIGKDGFTELMFYCCTERIGESKLDELIESMKNPEVLNAQAQNGNSALIYAVAHGNKDMVQSLLKSGADTKIMNIKGHDAMYFAKENNDQSIINLILASK